MTKKHIQEYNITLLTTWGEPIYCIMVMKTFSYIACNHLERSLYESFQ